MNKLKVGILGFAYFSHARTALHILQRMPEVEVVGVSHHDRGRVVLMLEQCGVPFYEQYGELLSTELDAVLVCSENVHHAEMTLAAIRAGKHVLCEKPLGVASDEMRQMVVEAKENGVRLMTMLTGCFHPAVMEAKRLIDSGKIGRVVALKGTNRGKFPGGWYTIPELSGGGAIIDHAVHVTGVMNLLTGSKAKAVYAEGGTFFRELNAEDGGIVHVTFENGAIAVIDPSWSRCDSFPFDVDFTAQVIGTEGVLALDCFNQKTENYLDRTPRAEWDYYGDSTYELMIEDFVRAVRDGTDGQVTGEDGLNASLVALAAYKSMKRGEMVTVD
ncbi:Gfo/Idh/MocA family protein [Paenibacillus ginsengarvi]|uniref:Gfo/Idh/MocA family oxidoreductase n=1 Tax=Paenibacillus ginsengarvi TaxID=400777 RepID=A0A3B0CQ51_9BACL|nr:Gfo/Idh/MocA family oxidoreductase [Paenibacillus ginsengarvi]RKN86079.1 gfo/Idh/MocA family oxidoreductase [Paenibacillus ginsengarvi]